MMLISVSNQFLEDETHGKVSHNIINFQLQFCFLHEEVVSCEP